MAVQTRLGAVAPLREYAEGCLHILLVRAPSLAAQIILNQIMADNEVATKAPESDAHESFVPGDTKAQEGPSMGVGQNLTIEAINC